MNIPPDAILNTDPYKWDKYLASFVFGSNAELLCNSRDPQSPLLRVRTSLSSYEDQESNRIAFQAALQRFADSWNPVRDRSYLKAYVLLDLAAHFRTSVRIQDLMQAGLNLSRNALFFGPRPSRLPVRPTLLASLARVARLNAPDASEPEVADDYHRWLMTILSGQDLDAKAVASVELLERRDFKKVVLNALKDLDSPAIVVFLEELEASTHLQLILPADLPRSTISFPEIVNTFEQNAKSVSIRAGKAPSKRRNAASNETYLLANNVTDDRGEQPNVGSAFRQLPAPFLHQIRKSGLSDINLWATIDTILLEDGGMQ